MLPLVILVGDVSFGVVLEGRSFKDGHCVVLGRGNDAIRAGGLVVTSEHLFGVKVDVSNCVARVPGEDHSVLGVAVSNRNNALALGVPCKVRHTLVDRDLVLDVALAVSIRHGRPDDHFAGLITRCDPAARRGEPSNLDVGGGLVARVHDTLGRVLQKRDGESEKVTRVEGKFQCGKNENTPRKSA